MKPNVLLNLGLVALLASAGVRTAHAANTLYAVADGNWSSISTWSASHGGSSGASVPIAGDTAIIDNGHTVTVDTAAACANLYLGGTTAGYGNGTLAFLSGQTLTCSAALTFGNAAGTTGSLNMGSGGLLQVGGTITKTSLGAFTPGSGTIEFNGTGAQTMLSSLPYNNLTVSGGNTKSLSGATTVSGTLTIASGITLADQGFTLSAQGDVANSGTHSITTLGKIALTGGSRSHTLSGAGTYGNLELNDANGATLTGGATVAGTLTLTSGNITTGVNQINLGSGATVTGASTASHVNGAVQKAFKAGSGLAFTFPIGDANTYDPVALSNLNPSGTTPTILASTTAGNHPNIGTSGLNPNADVAQSWTLTQVSGTFNTFTIGFMYPSSKASGTAASYQVKRYNASSWSSGGTISGTPTTTLTTIASVTGSGDFAIGVPGSAASRLLITLPNQIFIGGSGSGNSGTAIDQTAGASFSVTLSAVDANNVLDVTYSGFKTITSFTGPANAPSGATPTYPGSATFISGQATVTITLADAQSTTITPNISELTGFASSSLTVNAAAVRPSVSTVGAAPNSVTADDSSTSTITVTLKDAYSNPVSGKAVTLASSRGSTDTISAASGPSSGAGVVTFTVKSRTATPTGTSATFTATDTTDSNLEIGQPASVSFTAAAANKLAFTTQPGGGTGGTAWDVQPVVALQDLYGNTVTGAEQDVTLAIWDNAGPGGTMSGTTMVAVDTLSGAATFSGLSIDKAGTGYAVTATGNTVSTTPGNVVSGTFDIKVGPAAKLAFTTQPGGGVAGALLSPQPAVTLQDAGGNTVTGTAQDVTLAILNNPGNGTLSGIKVVAVDAGGVATFTDLSIDKAGNQYTLTATGSTVSTTPGGAVSDPFDINGPGKLTPTVTVAASQCIAYGTTSVHLSGTVVATTMSGDVPAQAGESVTVTINGHEETTNISGGAGGFSLDFPTASIQASATSYTIYYSYPGDAALDGAGQTGTSLTVTVAASSTMTLPGWVGSDSDAVVDFVAKSGATTLGAGQVTFAQAGETVTCTIGVPAGTTMLHVKPRFYLGRSIDVTGQIQDNEVAISLGSFIGGDADNNNKVDGTDYAWLRYYWGQNAPQYDLNGDGVINEADYAILKSGWYQAGENP